MDSSPPAPQPSSPRIRSAIAVLALLTLPACEWFSDFKEQPKVDPWEVVSTDSIATRGANDTVGSRGNPQMSVPITGTMMPAFAVSYSALPGTIDSMAGLVNLVAADARSLANGKMYYMINCMPCHGASGAGNGPVVAKGMVPISLVTDLAKSRTDGYLWGMIRNGRGLMPTYNRIEEMDRWDVVNYVRTLQGLGAQPADTTWTVVPGETGTKIPGYTRLGPTRPVPYARPAAPPAERRP